MVKKLKVKFNMRVPCEIELNVVDEKEFNANKESFIQACQDDETAQVIVSDYIEEYGIESVADTFYKDDLNREVENVYKVTDEKDNVIFEQNQK